MNFVEPHLFFQSPMKLFHRTAFGTTVTFARRFWRLFDNGGKAGKLFVHFFAAGGATWRLARTAFNEQFLRFAAGKTFIFEYRHTISPQKLHQ
jgi:hypothetical protein